MMKILVIDGNESRKKSTCQTLSHLGYDPLSTKNNSDLLKTIKNMTFDVILIDATIPVEDMEEKIKLIKNYSKNSCIIALESTVPEIKNNVEPIRKNINEVMYKPYKIEEIVFSLEEIIEKKRVLEKGTGIKINLLTPGERQEIRKKRQTKIIEEKITNLLKEPI